MNYLVRKWRTGLRILAVALVVASIPLPVLAQDGTQPAKPKGLQASIAPAVRVEAASAPQAQKDAVQAKPAETSGVGQGSFFKKPAGIIVLAIVAAGSGYALYSASHDRIPPTGR